MRLTAFASGAAVAFALHSHAALAADASGSGDVDIAAEREATVHTAAVEVDTLRETRNNSGATVGMAEFGAGLLTLPGATVCIDPKAGCSKGDNSLALEAWPLFRRGHFAAGAGIMMGVTSSTDAPHNDSPDVPRDHSRRYFSMEATARYYVPLGERIDVWGGVTTGLVVVNDTFQSQTGLTDKALVGPRGATVLTDGLSVGLGLGVEYSVAEHWRLGARARVSDWFFPHVPTKDPAGDEASLTGRVFALDMGLILSYRSRLVF